AGRSWIRPLPAVFQLGGGLIEAAQRTPSARYVITQRAELFPPPRDVTHRIARAARLAPPLARQETDFCSDGLGERFATCAFEGRDGWEWDAEFCCGCLACRCRSSFCWRCSGITEPRRRFV